MMQSIAIQLMPSIFISQLLNKQPFLRLPRVVLIAKLHVLDCVRMPVQHLALMDVVEGAKALVQERALATVVVVVLAVVAVVADAAAVVLAVLVVVVAVVAVATIVKVVLDV